MPICGNSTALHAVSCASGLARTTRSVISSAEDLIGPSIMTSQEPMTMRAAIGFPTNDLWWVNMFPFMRQKGFEHSR